MARWKRVAVLAVAAVVAAGVGVVVARGGDPVVDPHGGKDAAAYAESLLDRVPLPKSAQPFTGRLPPELGRVQELTFDRPKVNRHRVYRVRGEPATVLTDAYAHGLSGFGLRDYGLTRMGVFDSGLRQLAELTRQYGDLRRLDYIEARPPPGISASYLSLGTAASSAGGSLLRIDAQVVWRPLRAAADRVRASDRVVTIDRAKYGKRAEPGPPAPAHRVVTDRTTVARLITLFNRLPAEPRGGASNGQPPDCLDSEVRVGFARSANQAPDLTAAAIVGCSSSASWLVSAGAKSQPVLGGPMAVPAGRWVILDDSMGVFLAAVNAALPG